MPGNRNAGRVLDKVFRYEGEDAHFIVGLPRDSPSHSQQRFLVAVRAPSSAIRRCSFAI